MTTAFLFPGQGSQRPGMGEAFYEAWPEMRAAFDRIDDATDLDLAELCFGADADTLRRTEHTQPAVYAVGLSVAAALRRREGIEPEYVAGHSLGHYTAAGHAGLFDPADGARLVSARGRAMARAAERDGPGEMVAVLLADPETVTDCCREVEAVSVAAYNTPRQTVISGRADAVETARERIEDRGRARFSELDVGAAFHSPLMEPAVDDVARALEAADATEASKPIVSDVSGEAYTAPAVAREDLAVQVRSPVDWVAVAETLSDRGVDTFVELPPAGTLSRFVSRIDEEATVLSIEEPSSVESMRDSDNA